jgi:type VI secretion system secreted protein Hcp
MALNAYLTLKGQKQGSINGSVTQKGREGTIQVLSFSFGSESSDGKVDPAEFMLALDNDRSTAGIISAFVQNELLTEWKLDVYDTNAQGEEVIEQRWELTNGGVASFRTGAVIGSANGPANEVTFSFEKATYTWLDGGLTVDWDLNEPS